MEAILGLFTSLFTTLFGSILSLVITIVVGIITVGFGVFAGMSLHSLRHSIKYPLMVTFGRWFASTVDYWDSFNEFIFTRYIVLFILGMVLYLLIEKIMIDSFVKGYKLHRIGGVFLAGVGGYIFAGQSLIGIFIPTSYIEYVVSPLVRTDIYPWVISVFGAALGVVVYFSRLNTLKLFYGFAGANIVLLVWELMANIIYYSNDKNIAYVEDFYGIIYIIPIFMVGFYYYYKNNKIPNAS